MRKIYLNCLILIAMTLLFMGIVDCLAATPSACPAGTISCDGECTDVSIDELNCGSCKNTCPLGMACANGNCSCLGGQTLCNGKCVDTGIDEANCGACGKGCPGNLYCIHGSCSCPSGTLCNGACSDISMDDLNCGKCGFVCPPGTTCMDGNCLIIPIWIWR